jgi:EmrB/QacA subfamily drug resistance transporter
MAADGSARVPAVPAVRYTESRGRWVLAVTVGGSAVAQLEATVVNVALPTIGRDLDAGIEGLQWILNGYLLSLAALILLGGSLGDRFGRRRMFVVGVVWFTAASMLCALAPTIELLIAARVLQGVGGALLTPGSLAIIEATFVPDDRPRAIGAWSALGGVAAAVGPLVGGLLVDVVSWRWVFLVSVPVGVAVVAAAVRYVPETRDPQAGGSDVAGTLLVTLGLAGVTYALIDAEGGLDATTVAAAVGGVAALALFVVVERRAESPLLPLSIFRSRQFTAANLVTFVVYGAMGGVFFLLVAELQIGLGYSAVAAGAASLPMTVIMLLFAARGGALAQRIGPRIPLTVGPLVIAAGMLLMLRIEPGASYVGAVLPAVVVFGAGLVFVVAPVTATVLAAAEDRHAGVASGVNNAVARTASLVAVAVLPLVAGLSGDAYRDPQALTEAFHTAMLATAAVAASGGVLAWFTIRSDVLGRAAEPSEPAAAERQFTHCAVAGPPLRSASGQPGTPA